jgi:ParB-like chromosome segregation protein Spo0J
MNPMQLRPAEELIPYARNSRTHSESQVTQLAASIDEFGMAGAIVIREGVIAKGHGTLSAIKQLFAAGKALYPVPGKKAGAEAFPAGMVPVLDATGWTEAQFRAYVIADNKLAELAGWDSDLLSIELADLQADGFEMDLLGFDNAELGDLLNIGNDVGADAEEARATLAERFMLAPFTVLDARRGWWQDRKRAWLALGLKSEQGRAELLTFSNSSQPPAVYAAKNAYEAKIGREASWDEFLQANPGVAVQSGTSIFDPVMCEVAYRWFCPPGGTVLDPFSGGSVRGIVAAKTGRQYAGCDLRGEQVQANREQWAGMGDETSPAPAWACGDSRNIDQHLAGVAADMVFSCPPYADLEVYSDSPDDLSNMDYPEFVAAYREIIAKAVGMLKPDRFACFVVGDVRDKQGIYRNFVGDTIAAFEAAGARYYNEAVLVTSTGSLAIRAGKQFSASRKLGKTHQNVLVFVKGDPKRATEACGPVEVDESLFESESVD